MTTRSAYERLVQEFAQGRVPRQILACADLPPRFASFPREVAAQVNHLIAASSPPKYRGEPRFVIGTISPDQAWFQFEGWHAASHLGHARLVDRRGYSYQLFVVAPCPEGVLIEPDGRPLSLRVRKD